MMIANFVQNKTTYAHGLVVVLLTLGIGALPPFAAITPYGMKILGVFTGLVYGWIFVGMAWPSLFAMIALAFTGYGSVEAIFGEGFGNSSLQLVLWVFILVSYLDTTGLTKFIAEWCVSRKICVGRPWLFTLMLMLAAVFLAAFTNAFATLAICWSLAFSSCEALGFQKDDRYVVVLMMGITLMACIACVIMPFRSVAVLLNKYMEAAVGFSVAGADWLIFQVILVALMTAAYFLICRFLVKPDLSPFTQSNQDIYASLRKNKMTGRQKWASAMLTLFLIIVIVPSFFSAAHPLIGGLKRIGIVGGACLCLIILNFVKDGEKKALAEISDCCRQGINWNLILMLAASFPVANALEQDEAGIIPAVLNSIMPIITQMSPVLFIITIIIVFGIITQFIHNLILMIVFTPLIAQVCLIIGFPPELFVCIFATVTNMALVTPGSSVMGAMMHGNTQWVSTKNIYWGSLAIVTLALIILILFGIPLGFLIW